jgi:hypothetical protein
MILGGILIFISEFPDDIGDEVWQHSGIDQI